MSEFLEDTLYAEKWDSAVVNPAALVPLIEARAKTFAAIAGGTAAGALAAKPVGNLVGRKSIGKDDPHYDMNRRAGEAVFHARRKTFQNEQEEFAEVSKKRIAGDIAKIGSLGIVPGAVLYAHNKKKQEEVAEAGSGRVGRAVGKLRQVGKNKSIPATGQVAADYTPPSKLQRAAPAAAAAVGGAIVAKRGQSGYKQGQLDKRRQGVNTGYVDAYKKAYPKKEEQVDEAEIQERLFATLGKAASKLKPGSKAKIAGLGLAGAGAVASIPAYKGLKKFGGAVMEDKEKPNDPDDDFAEDAMYEAGIATGKRVAGAGIKWGGRGLVGLDLGILGLQGAKAAAGRGKKAVSPDKQEEEVQIEERYKGEASRRGVDLAMKHGGKTLGRADVGLFGAGTLYGASNKAKDYRDDKKLNQSHLRNK